jgi:hypothetical protein
MRSFASQPGLKLLILSERQTSDGIHQSRLAASRSSQQAADENTFPIAFARPKYFPDPAPHRKRNGQFIRIRPSTAPFFDSHTLKRPEDSRDLYVVEERLLSV